ncbi:MAG: enoyl-CoA hydratase/isomerase family protein [Burkholderiaceae bacterium]
MTTSTAPSPVTEVPAALPRILEEQSGRVRWITVNRPGKHNAFAPGVLAELSAAFDRAEQDAGVAAVVVTGAGTKAFVAGNDVEALAAMSPVAAYRDMVAGHKLMQRIHDFPKPTVAAVNGYALGGGFELALACDFIVATTTAKFGFPEIALNTMPGWGGTQLAVLKMGLVRAKEMVLTGNHYRVDDCLPFGFISRVVAPETLRAQAQSFAESLTRHHPVAQEMAKRAVNRAAEMPLHAGLEFEAATYAFNFGTPHAREGFRRFLEK